MSENKKDFQDLKIIAVFTYLIFFLPFLTEYKNDHFLKFHANQSLVLLIFGILGSIIFSFLVKISSGILFFLPSVFALIFIGFLVIGMVNAYEGKKKKLPIIGHLEIIK